MENKVCAKPMYKCAVCGEVYDSIAKRMTCEQACLKQQEEEAKKVAEAKKAAEYDARVEEVNKAFDRAYELRDKLAEDYGEYHHARRINDLTDLFEALFVI